jgi:hypothetical protein
LFPFILIAIEYCLRLALHTELTAFAGPALASASAGFVIPLTGPKQPSAALSESARRELEDINVTIRSNRDELYRAVAVLLLLLSIAAWVWCLVLAETKDRSTVLGLPRSLIVGFACYFIAIIASEIKEAQ